MDIETIRGLMTLMFLIAFIAIVLYAWSSRNRARFDEVARLILDDDADAAQARPGSRQGRHAEQRHA